MLQHVILFFSQTRCLLQPSGLTQDRDIIYKTLFLYILQHWAVGASVVPRSRSSFHGEVSQPKHCRRHSYTHNMHESVCTVNRYIKLVPSARGGQQVFFAALSPPPPPFCILPCGRSYLFYVVYMRSTVGVVVVACCKWKQSLPV